MGEECFYRVVRIPSVKEFVACLQPLLESPILLSLTSHS